MAESEHEPRTAIISGAVTARERQLIRVAAQKAGVTMSRFIGDATVRAVHELYAVIQEQEQEETDADAG